MANKNFEDYGFKPSAVIEALNKWYEHGGYRFFSIELPDSKEGVRKYHAFYDRDKAIDDAIKYLRSIDIFYQPGMKWDDVKYKLSTEACIREFGYSCVTDAWPKVYLLSRNYADIYDFTDQKKKFDQWKTERDREARDKELRDYIFKLADAADIKIYIRDKSPEELICYLISLLVRYRNDTKVERERADGYLEKIDRLQKELDGWDCWYNDKEHYVK